MQLVTALIAPVIMSYSLTFLYFLPLQANERMKIVDVLGAKQFSDGERIITQV